jgi:sugar-specific transcriptional regulator TrmB
MSTDRQERLEAECASLIQEFGYSKYEAYTFVYLLRLGPSTAREIADFDGVPRTRVYDAVETLHEDGLVDVKYDSPQQYAPVSRETAIQQLDLQRQNTITELSEVFAELDPVENRPEEFGVWTVTSREAVTNRVLEFVEDADDQVVYMTVDELLTDGHLDALASAANRSVDVYIGGVSADVQGQIQDQIPSASTFETLWEWSELGAGRILITDERTALASVLVEDGGRGVPDETAIWGSGARNSLVVILRALFTSRLGDEGSDADGE